MWLDCSRKRAISNGDEDEEDSATFNSVCCSLSHCGASDNACNHNALIGPNAVANYDCASSNVAPPRLQAPSITAAALSPNKIIGQTSSERESALAESDVGEIAETTASRAEKAGTGSTAFDDNGPLGEVSGLWGSSPESSHSKSEFSSPYLKSIMYHLTCFNPFL